MTTYNVLGCLGSSVGSVSTIEEAKALVLQQVPISTKTADKLSRQLAKASVGDSVEVDYGGSGCTVIVE